MQSARPADARTLALQVRASACAAAALHDPLVGSTSPAASRTLLSKSGSRHTDGNAARKSKMVAIGFISGAPRDDRKAIRAWASSCTTFAMSCLPWMKPRCVGSAASEARAASFRLTGDASTSEPELRTDSGRHFSDSRTGPFFPGSMRTTLTPPPTES